MPLVSVDAKKIAQRELEDKDKAAAESAKVEKKPVDAVLYGVELSDISKARAVANLSD